MPQPPRYAVFGHPIRHSLSPRIHAAFGEALGIALEYTSIDATPEAFDGAVNAFFAGGGYGANITLPHKGTAYRLAVEYSVAARRAGTANVLTRRDNGHLAAHNTDGTGLLRDLSQRHRLDLAGRRALLLGAGGAAYGIAWQLLEAGLAELLIVNRSPGKAEALAAAIDQPAARRHPWTALAELAAFDFIFNATSAGVLAKPLELPPNLVGAKTCGYDLSYGPAAHRFLDWANRHGAGTALDGLGMLVETAADSFALWHGERPATDAVYAMLRNDGQGGAHRHYAVGSDTGVDKTPKAV